jgi:hypothetical protein
MKAGKNDAKPSTINPPKEWIEKWQKKGFVKHTIEGFTYLSPPLVKRERCFTYNPSAGCLYCGNNTFRYYSSGYGKKYYQCEKCQGVN